MSVRFVRLEAGWICNLVYRFLALPNVSPCHLGADIVRRDYAEEWRSEKASFVDRLMLIKGLQNHPMTFEQYLKIHLSGSRLGMVAVSTAQQALYPVTPLIKAGRLELGKQLFGDDVID